MLNAAKSNGSHPLPQEDLSRLAGLQSMWEPLRGKVVFVTGASGFFGTWLIESFLTANALHRLGARVVALTRSPENLAIAKPHLTRDAAVQWIAGDVRDFEFPAVTCDFIVHAATDSRPVCTAGEGYEALDVAYTGTRRVLEFARTTNARRLLFVSSGAVYGSDRVSGPIDETCSTAPNPISLSGAYGEGKRVAEQLCALAAQETSLHVCVARCFAFVGPGQPLHAPFAAAQFVRSALAGEDIVVNGPPAVVRSYLYASDLAEWLWTILVRGASLRPYNVGSDEAVTVADLARCVAALGNVKARICEESSAAGRAGAYYVPCTKRVFEELGLFRRVPLDEALRKTLAWHSTNQ